MTWSRLVCASCAGPVSEGRCPTCRLARAQLHASAIPAALLAALAVVVVLLTSLALVARAA